MTRLRIVLHVSFAIIVLLLLGFSNRPALAHGGGIDAYGGHNDNKKGNYHAHQGTCAGRTFVSPSTGVLNVQNFAGISFSHRIFLSYERSGIDGRSNTRRD